MRTLVRDKTIVGCAKAVSRKVKEGWEPITKIKIDDSMASYGEVEYVCVMERKDNPEQEATKRKRRFNKGTVSYL